MLELLVPITLFVATLVAALRLPVWRSPAGPVAELVSLTVLLELHASGVLPQNLLPSSCVLLTAIAYVALRLQRVLSAPAAESAEPATAKLLSSPPRWKALLAAQLKFDRRSVASSLHLLPFTAFALVPQFMTGTYEPDKTMILTGFAFGFVTLSAPRFGVVTIVLGLSVAFLGSWQTALDLASQLLSKPQ